jgi:tRNA U34 5-carboxymethylaminomethyl modifying GTPase MnmE/TrmE
MSFSTQDTIVAIATPPGRGGIGIVRLSGPDALTLGQALITHRDPLQPRQATFTRVVLPQGTLPHPDTVGVELRAQRAVANEH